MREVHLGWLDLALYHLDLLRRYALLHRRYLPVAAQLALCATGPEQSQGMGAEHEPNQGAHTYLDGGCRRLAAIVLLLAKERLIGLSWSVSRVRLE